ncbi:hypothetical protein [Aestuariivirga sp.]|uniref:hypothetical protein n=1 Tax=Aestuariivirga sp. TaxID=2650926 RepID=UPI003BAB6D08
MPIRKPVVIGLDDLARSQSFGPIAIGASLRDIGPLLHAPRYWGFGLEEKLNFYASFGGIEVHFETEFDMPRVRYAELSISTFKGNVVRFLDKYAGGSLRLRNNLPQGGNEFESAKRFFVQREIQFTTSFEEQVMDETAAVLNCGRLHFYYRDHECPVLDLISLS